MGDTDDRKGFTSFLKAAQGRCYCREEVGGAALGLNHGSNQDTEVFVHQSMKGSLEWICDHKCPRY